jgi:Zn-dependent protease
MKVAKIRGIDVRIHWTFWVLILFYLFSVSRSAGLVGGVTAVAFIVSVFFCVLLHEFGHALAAEWYGIPTRDITLLPIGGVARLERMPEKPVQELVVALAGPAVNVIIAVLLVFPIALGVLSSTAAPVVSLGTSFFVQLLMVNIILVCFNMLPAFPMDGGRVLRSLLAIRLGHLRATQIAARLGRWMALSLGIWAILSGNIMLLLLAVFVFIAGTAELMQVKMRSWQTQSELQLGREHQFGQAVPWPYRTSEMNSAEPGWQYQTKPPNEEDVIDAIEVRQIR